MQTCKGFQNIFWIFGESPIEYGRFKGAPPTQTYIPRPRRLAETYIRKGLRRPRPRGLAQPYIRQDLTGRGIAQPCILELAPTDILKSLRRPPFQEACADPVQECLLSPHFKRLAHAVLMGPPQTYILKLPLSQRTCSHLHARA